MSWASNPMGSANPLRRLVGLALAASLTQGLLLPLPLGAQPAPLRAVQVFVSLSQRSTQAERAEYLKANAGSAVDGAGRIEAVLPRAYYDTSVPDANLAVALIQLSPGRKVVCGLPKVPSREDFQRFGEGAPVTFRGTLVDAHDWQEWSTLYLGDCTLQAR